MLIDETEFKEAVDLLLHIGKWQMTKIPQICRYLGNVEQQYPDIRTDLQAEILSTKIRLFGLELYQYDGREGLDRAIRTFLNEPAASKIVEKIWNGIGGWVA